MIQKKIVYVAYSPYENQGKILDYILEKYKHVFLFSIGHYNIDKDRITNKLYIYKNKKICKEIGLLHLPLPSKLVFILLPLRSISNFIQIVWYIWMLKREYNKIEHYFAVNGFAAWIGIILKRLKLVSKTIYWVTDYYPINHKNIVITAMRWLYWNFEKKTVRSDRLTFHNNRLVKVWEKQGVLPTHYKALLTPIGTISRRINIKRKKHSPLVLCFLGVLKKSQGLDFIFDCAKVLKKDFPNVKLNVIGPGPDMKYFKHRALIEDLNCYFFGYIDEKKIDEVISESTIGLAPYVPDPSNVSYYGDPGKIKRYISNGVPVIATKIHEFSEQLKINNAGILVKYGNSKQLTDAIKKILKRYTCFSRNALVLNRKYNYKKIYERMFQSL